MDEPQIIVDQPVIITTPPVGETKIYWKSSEFWLIIATNLLAILAMVADVLPPEYGIPVQGMMNGLYAIARGIAKSGLPPKP